MAERGSRAFGPPQQPRKKGLTDLPVEGFLMLGGTGPCRAWLPPDYPFIDDPDRDGKQKSSPFEESFKHLILLKKKWKILHLEFNDPLSPNPDLGLLGKI